MRVPINEIIRPLEGDNRVLAVYLLGSAASGDLRPESDIDFGLLLEPGATMGALERGDLAAGMAYVAGRTVDIGILDAHNLVYAREALLTGRRLYARDATRADRRAHDLLCMYLVFNEDRREVLDAYRAR